MSKYKNKIMAGVVAIALLAFVFWYGGDAPALRGWSPESENGVSAIKENVVTEKELPETEEHSKETNAEYEKKLIEQAHENKTQDTDNTEKEADENITTVKNNDFEVQRDYPQLNGMVIKEDTGRDKYMTEPVPEGKPVPVEPSDVLVTDKELTCTLSVRCDTIIENIEWLNKEKVEIVPRDGIIFEERTVTFFEGESVFNLLLREMKRNKIHMEFENVPLYNSAYIEGIANLYEFDCGELSGWMYKVNGWFPNYGCSRYQLEAGDKVEWVYTCNMGVDVGGHYASR